MPMQPATVYVVDDDPAVRDSIAALVDVRGYPVETFGLAEDFLERVTPKMAGCVVTDIRIEHGMSGIELQRTLRARGCALPVIVISAYANVSSAVQAMEAGAVTLIEKSCSTEELWAAIEVALKRDKVAQAERERLNDVWEKFRTLKLEEVEVMVRVIKGVLNKVIAQELKISLRTVESRRASVLKKIDVTSVPELVRLYVALESECGRPPEDLLNPQPGAEDEDSSHGS